MLAKMVLVNQNDIQGKVKEDLVLDMLRNGQCIWRTSEIRMTTKGGQSWWNSLEEESSILITSKCYKHKKLFNLPEFQFLQSKMKIQ